MPRTKKPAGTAVRPYNGRRAELLEVAGGRIDPPTGLSPAALEIWDAYWNDTVSSVQSPVDRGLLARWITEYDRYLRTVTEADLNPIVTGSTGQQVENPLYKIAYRALEAAERCERQMGVGALNRSNLGIAVISERKSLADMNTRYGGAHADGDSTPTPVRADPRVIEAAG
jgi:phage terminase small subunit